MEEVLVNPIGGLSLPRKSVVRLTDCRDMTIAVYRGRKTTQQQQQYIVGSQKKFLNKASLTRSHDICFRRNQKKAIFYTQYFAI